jgi:hypothetical protein
MPACHPTELLRQPMRATGLLNPTHRSRGGVSVRIGMGYPVA